ncbi:hypothetical protein [uncultured Bradyrhizobium sp.]|uniref:hypothetical protein n=1 Tax=uncultured Bradyrhizobium sp. TaxID=199684 RepID=UPI00262AC40A|nr:hypothetical protein [uncultured Bradyrhizobium sp.]
MPGNAPAGAFPDRSLLIALAVVLERRIRLLILIGSFGGPRRQYAAVKFFLYSFLGGLIMLGAVIGLYVVSAQAGSPTYSLQELSAMEWWVLMRRCPRRSFTIVGDLAQRRSAAGVTSWQDTLEPYVDRRWLYRPLLTNYRTPSEIMAVAAAVLAEFAPDVTPPESVRSCGAAPITAVSSAMITAEVDEAEVIYWGLCPNCSTAQPSTRSAHE